MPTPKELRARWDRANSLERVKLIRDLVWLGTLSPEYAISLFGLTKEGFASILQGQEWRAEFIADPEERAEAVAAQEAKRAAERSAQQSNIPHRLKRKGAAPAKKPRPAPGTVRRSYKRPNPANNPAWVYREKVRRERLAELARQEKAQKNEPKK